MKKVFVFASTDYEVESAVSPELRKVVAQIKKRTLIVETPDLIGVAVIICDTIVTSLLLVRNFQMVNICFRNGIRSKAIVTAKDEENNLAMLRELSLGETSKSLVTEQFNIGHIAEIGSPLLTTNTASGKSKVYVAGTKYLLKLCERKEETLKIDPGSPRGMMGSGVWNDNGQFVGIAIGQKIPSVYDQVSAYPKVYALPSDEVMEFVERRN